MFIVLTGLFVNGKIHLIYASAARGIMTSKSASLKFAYLGFKAGILGYSISEMKAHKK